MSSLSSALRIAIGGMQSSQMGLGTVAHNVTNANTTGYTRQQVNTTNISYNGFGAGVQVSNVQRVTDIFLNTRVLNQTSEVDATTTRRAYLDTVEGAFTGGSAEASLDNLVSKMFSSFNTLANDPGNSALKRNAVQQMGLVTDSLNDINENLNDVAQRVDVQLTEELDQINALLVQINQLNKEIAAQHLNTNNGANANDLLDQRDRQLDELAKRFKLNIISNGTSNAIRVTTEGGQKLLDESSYVQFERTGGTPYQGIGFRNITVSGDPAQYVNTLNTSKLTTGRIDALLELRDETVPALVAQMDEFANTMKNQINTIASQGVTSPPQRTLLSWNTGGVTSASSDLLTELSSGLNGASFNLSLVDSQGDVIETTVGGTAITIAPTLPATTLSLNDIVDAINNSAVGVTTLGAGNGITASVGTDSDGNPYLQMQATNSNLRVVGANVSGDFFGIMGFNNLLTGEGSGEIAVRSDIAADPALMPTSRMRTDGGVSALSNANILALAQLSDTNVNFSAAGGLAGQNVTMVGYVGQVTSNLAVTMSEAQSDEQYAEALYNQLSQLKGSVGGVNMNEELSLMLVYQQGFQASARIITVVDGLLQELMGVVGR